MLKQKRGILPENVVGIIIAVVLIAVIGVGFLMAAERITTGQEKLQARESLERFSNFLKDLENPADYAHAEARNSFLIYSPKNYYLNSFSKRAAGLPLECIDKECICACEEEFCTNEKSYCKTMGKPLALPEGKPIKIGITEISVKSNKVYVVSEVRESSEKLETYQKDIDPQTSVIIPPGGFIPAPSRGDSRIELIVLHHTAGSSWEGAYDTFKSRPHLVSSHYILDKDGKIYYTVGESKKALHAGNQGGINARSIGIEIVNKGNEPFTDQQYASLNTLLKDITKRYEISYDDAHILGHYETPQGMADKKKDPSKFFEWARIGLPNHKSVDATASA